MKLKLFLNSAAIALLSFLVSGCSLMSPATKNIRYYDLNCGKIEKYTVPCRFAVRSFHNISPARMNFLYNMENSAVELDQYNLWVQSPEIMLNRYILNAIIPSNDKNALQLNAILTVFEFKFDTVNKKSVLGIKVLINDTDNNRKFEKTYIIESAVVNVRRVDFVNAMTECVEKFVNQAVNDIKKI